MSEDRNLLETNVLNYLLNHYEVRLVDLSMILNHAETQAELEAAYKMKSLAYYPAERIANRAGWKHKNPCEACDKEEQIEEAEE